MLKIWWRPNMCWHNWPDTGMLIFANFLHRYNISKWNSGVTLSNLTKFWHDVIKFIALNSANSPAHRCSSILLHFSIAVCQWKLVPKNADFAFNIGCHGNVLSDSQMNPAGFINPLQSYTNPENFVKIRRVVLEISMLISWLLKIIITRNAWQSLAYSPLGATVSPPSKTKPCYHLAKECM